LHKDSHSVATTQISSDSALISQFKTPAEAQMRKATAIFTLCVGSSLTYSADLKNLTDSVMNGWRADYLKQMSSILDDSGCRPAVDLRNLADSVMNGWRADFEKQTGALLSCSGCQSSVDLRNLTDSVMNKWRADYERQMSSLIICIKK
jgi:hypothetical protein